MIFDRARDLYNLKRKADDLKKKMGEIVVEVESGEVKIVMHGDQTVAQVFLAGAPREDLKTAFNKAVRQSQKEVGKKMRKDLSGLGIPGLGES